MLRTIMEKRSRKRDSCAVQSIGLVVGFSVSTKPLAASTDVANRGRRSDGLAPDYSAGAICVPMATECGARDFAWRIRQSA